MNQKGKSIIETIKSIVLQLKKLQDKLTTDEFLTHDRANRLAQNLQLAINAYKSETKKKDIDQKEVSEEIKKIIDSSGFIYEGEKEGKSFGSQLEGKDLKNLENNWTDITGDIIVLNPNDPEIIKLVHDKLSIPEEKLVFRMMDKTELQNIMNQGYIGGSSEKQIEADTTWWGNGLQDSLSQRRGKIRMTDTGQTWGGEEGVLVAVKREAIQDVIS